MRLATTPLLSSLLSLLFVACGGGGGETTETTAQTAPQTDGTSVGTSTAGTSTGDLTTSVGTTVGESATGSTTEDPTSTSHGSTTHGHTTGTTGETTTGTTAASETTASETTAAETGETTTGGMMGGPCQIDADCALHNDCCDCFGHPAGENQPICKALCEQKTCEQWGVNAAVCQDGQCTVPKSNCKGEVACDALPPPCPVGTLPAIDSNGTCWTGGCAPVEQCAAVSGCGDCPEGMMCVQKVAQMQSFVCAPIPDACDGKPNCKCAGEVCQQPFGQCAEAQNGADLACLCLAC